MCQFYPPFLFYTLCHWVMSQAAPDEYLIIIRYNTRMGHDYVPLTARSYFASFVIICILNATVALSQNQPLPFLVQRNGHLISSQSLNLGGRRGTTDDVATIPFHPSLSSAALRESPNPIPVHSLMLASHLFFCLPLLPAPFTVPCRIVFAMPKDLEMWPYHLSFRSFTMVRRSSCTPIAFWILLRTSSFVPWSL